MNNRIESHYSINIGTPEGLEIFKHWLNDHNEGSQTGGLGCFATFPDGFIYDDLPSENLSFEGEPVMSNWEYDDFIFHMMTFVGYNDSIKYDINNDDLFTNDIDINEDGEINMLDWEIGALKLVNSGGEDWPPGVTNPEGYCWMPYRLLPLELSEPSNPDKITPVI